MVTLHEQFDLKEMQQKLYDMFVVFHEVCLKHGIQYYMLAGTMLGAVRHQNFIPWDDDIDVGLYRGEYEKLMMLPSQVWPAQYRVMQLGTDSHHPYFFAKLVDSTTTLVEDIGREHVIGTYIDIFPLDGAGDRWSSVILRRKLIATLWSCRNVSRFVIDKKRNIWMTIALRAVRCISPLTYTSMVFFLMGIYNSASSKYVGNYLGAWGLREIMDKSIYGEPKLYKFYAGEFYGVEKPHEYLSSLYGDYRKLPPVEKRVSHHRFKYVNLHLPYDEYLRLRDTRCE